MKSNWHIDHLPKKDKEKIEKKDKKQKMLYDIGDKLLEYLKQKREKKNGS